MLNSRRWRSHAAQYQYAATVAANLLRAKTSRGVTPSNAVAYVRCV